MKNISIRHLQFSSNVLLRGIEFYRLELQMMQERLDEIAADNTGKNVQVSISYFQNQLIIHREQLDLLKHEIHIVEELLAADLNGTPAFVNETTFMVAKKLMDEYDTEERIFSALRYSFNQFAAEWM